MYSKHNLRYIYTYTNQHMIPKTIQFDPNSIPDHLRAFYDSLPKNVKNLAALWQDLQKLYDDSQSWKVNLMALDHDLNFYNRAKWADERTDDMQTDY